MLDRRMSACLGLALVVFLPASGPVFAQWPGDKASLGGALAARVIGKLCPGVLSASEIAEIEAYIDKTTREQIASPERESKESGGKPFPIEQFRRDLTETYEKKYRDPQNCDATAAEEARDTLRRVRKAMAGDAR